MDLPGVGGGVSSRLRFERRGPAFAFMLGWERRGLLGWVYIAPVDGRALVFRETQTHQRIMWCMPVGRPRPGKFDDF